MLHFLRGEYLPALLFYLKCSAPRSELTAYKLKYCLPIFPTTYIDISHVDKNAAEKRIAGSVYGVYWLLKALYHLDVDHGQLALDILTQCDTNSYCHMLQNGATCVMIFLNADLPCACDELCEG